MSECRDTDDGGGITIGRHGDRAAVCHGGAGDRTWNGKFNSSSSKLCSHFNFNRDHPATALQPDGTCKARHACDAWVDNKGKGGRCLGSAGTAGHARHNCDNPHRCDAPVQ